MAKKAGKIEHHSRIDTALSKAGKAQKAGKPDKNGKHAVKALPGEMTPVSNGTSAVVLDRLWDVVLARRSADPALSHSARLLSRGTAKVAQKFGEESVECIIEAVAGNKAAMIAESADVLYHLLVLWVSAGVHPSEVWSELEHREGVSGIAEKAARRVLLPTLPTRKIP